MNDQEPTISDPPEPEPCQVVMTKGGYPGKYVGDGLALAVVRGALVIAEYDPKSKTDITTLCSIMDLEVLAASVMWHYLKRSPA